MKRLRRTDICAQSTNLVMIAGILPPILPLLNYRAKLSKPWLPLGRRISFLVSKT